MADTRGANAGMPYQKTQKAPTSIVQLFRTTCETKAEQRGTAERWIDKAKNTLEIIGFGLPNNWNTSSAQHRAKDIQSLNKAAELSSCQHLLLWQTSLHVT